MGKIEESSRRRAKRNELRKIVLNTVQIAGVLSLALVAPNVLGAMARMGLIPSARQSETVRNTSKRLVKSGHMIWKNGNLQLTPKGERELRRLSLEEFAGTTRRRWDGKWRVLIFDIPERRKGLRQRVRSMLLKIGFARLQLSVWAYPYDCEDLVALLKADFHVGDDILYMIVDSIERDRHLRDHFSLK